MVLITWLGACARAEGPVLARDGGNAEASPQVELVAVIARPLATTVRLEGEIAPEEAVALYARVTSFIEAITVDRGDRVQRGQILCRLVAPELVAQRAEAEARLQSEEQTLERLRKSAAAPGVVAPNELAVAEASARASRARVEALRALAEYLVLRAPFDGVITERLLHPGALVGPAAAAPLLRLERVLRLRLVVAVPEAQVASVRAGEPMEFAVRAWPGRHFAGKVARLSRTLDPRTRTMAVELDIDNRAGALAPGMFAEVSWALRRDAPSLFVPRTAVLRTTERVFVERVRAGLLTHVPVRTGVAVDDLIEVFGEISAGDSVLRRGMEDLPSGTRVRPLESVTAPAPIHSR